MNTSKKNLNQEVQNRIESIIRAAQQTGRNLTLKQAYQIEEKSQQLSWEGHRQTNRNKQNKAREIEAAFLQRENQKQQNQ